MGWSLQTRPDAVLEAGATIRFTLHYSYLPLLGVKAQLIQDALQADTPLFVSEISESFLSQLGVSDEWDVTASITSSTSVGELSAQIAIVLNKWYSWGVSVTDLKTQTWTPDLTPSTQTAVSLASFAIIAVIGFLIARKGGLL